jgi:hypothetical protein
MFILPSSALPTWDTSWDEPEQVRPHDKSTNNITMNTSVIAGKYGVDSLKPLFLESLELRNLIDEHYRSAKIVYDADVDDGIFREFFKRELMIKLEDVFGPGGRDLSLSIHKNPS